MQMIPVTNLLDIIDSTNYDEPSIHKNHTTNQWSFQHPHNITQIDII